MQAGLGGGSSDAAAALLGLRRLWKLRVPDEQISRAGREVGSDVPFFLVGGTALGLGRGEEVYPLENLPRYRVVLVIPPFGVATKRRLCVVGRARKGVGRPRPLFRSVLLPDTWLGRTTRRSSTISRAR